MHVLRTYFSICFIIIFYAAVLAPFTPLPSFPPPVLINPQLFYVNFPFPPSTPSDCPSMLQICTLSIVPKSFIDTFQL